MDPIQVSNVASPAEETLIREIAATKDRLINAMKTFRAEAENVRTNLRPHRTDVLRFPDVHSQAERRAALADAIHNLQAVRPLACAWGLPITAELTIDPSYLVDRPFSGAPWLEGTAAAVTQFGEERLPLVVLHVDVRFPRSLLLQRIDDHLSAAVKEWKRRKGNCYVDPRRELRKHRLMAEAVELGEQEITQDEIAARLAVDPRYVRQLFRAWRAMESKRTVWMVAPYTHVDWAMPRMQAESGHLEDTSRLGVPIRIQPLT